MQAVVRTRRGSAVNDEAIMDRVNALISERAS